MQLLEEASSDSTQNVCETETECAGGRCLDGICQATSTQLPPLLLEISPSTQQPLISGITYTQVIDQFDGGTRGTEIKLGHVSRIEGAVRGALLTGDACLLDEKLDLESLPERGSDGSLPVRVTLTPRERLLGLTNQPITSAVEVPNLSAEAPEPSFRLAFSAPPGSYDIYVEPAPTRDGCVRPPYLVVNREVAPGDVNLSVELPQPDRLAVRVRYPLTIDELRDWTLDMVDRDSGRLLSNQATLGAPETTDDGLEYSVELAYQPVDSEKAGVAAELVRLSPPEGFVAPTLYVERSIVDLFQDGSGLIDQLTELPRPVTFGGRMAIAKKTTAAPGKVTFIATELSSTSPGTLAAFSRTVETDEEGVFELELLPGTYRLYAEPYDTSLSRVQAGISVSGASETQVGKTIEVVSRNVVTGQIQSFSGIPVSGAPVTANAAPEARDVLQTALGEVSFAPRAFGGTTGSSGGFEIVADTGRFHVVARPDSSTGFAWRVILDVDVEGGSQSLGTVRLPLPLAVSGTLTSQDTGSFVPEALIRMFALIKDGVPVNTVAEADSAVAIGEARADSQGQFRLLLPSSLTIRP